MGYPVTADVEAILDAAGITSPGSTLIDQQIDSAIAEFEALTGFKPFYVDLESSHGEFPFDPPRYGNELDLLGGFTSIEGVTIGVAYEVAGTELTFDRDFELLPRTVPSPSPTRGWTKIKFFVPFGIGRIVVSGQRGLYNELPADVFNAIAARAAALVVGKMPGTEVGTAVGAAKRIKQGAREVEYAVASTAGSQTGIVAWNDEFYACASRYTPGGV